MALSNENSNNIKLNEVFDKENLSKNQKSLKLINTKLTSEAEEIINALEPILQASNTKQRTKAIEEAAKTLGKSTRTIRRMLDRIAHEGVATLSTGRQDKGQSYI